MCEQGYDDEIVRQIFVECIGNADSNMLVRHIDYPVIGPQLTKV